ncbi:flagellin [Thermosulfurimonas dismutans]|uniref:Flagellin n=1 Tax=Thermosulfurimonas dismutans TaxID=999894 RepID=A0A179D346_9BACT|nr:flagellin [Thermosulfurimonas dismutans]OAQ20466.1 Flagellin protein FlaA [Thermosulfurimonas dismutans]
MALRINFNYESASTHTALKANERMMNQSLLRLSTGLRILSAQDDAAGLFIADQLSVVAAGLYQGNQNIQTGLSALRIAENSLGQIFTKLQAMYTRVESAANDINDVNARAALQREIDNFRDAIDKIAADTEYNGIHLLNGDFQGKKIHYGARKDQTVTVNISNMRASQLGAYLETGNGGVSTKFEAQTSGGSLANFTANVNTVANNFVLSGTSEYVRIAGTTVYQGDATTNYLIDAKSLADAINSNDTLSNLGITATASNTSTADTTYNTANVVNASATAAAGASDETFTVYLNFYIGDGSTSFQVQLGTITVAAGSTTVSKNIADLDTLVNRINTAAGAAGAPIVATNSDGKLQLTTNDGETIGIEAQVTAPAGTSAAPDVTIDFSQLLQGGNNALQVASALAAGTSEYGGQVKVGTINIGGIDSFLFEYAGVSGTTSGNVGFNFTDTSGTNVGLTSITAIDVSSNSNAETYLLVVEKALQKVDKVRSQIGAIMNNLQSIYDAQKTAYDNTKEAENVIRNVDYAEEMSRFTTFQIRMQSGIAMLAQANQLPQLVLQLLR